MPIVKILGIILFSYVLGKTTDHLIKHVMSFSKVFKIGQFEATAVVVALATSLPEILVSVSSSLAGLSQLALGNAIGSNVVNLSLVVGITAVAGRSLHFNKGDGAIREKFLPIAYTLIPFLMLGDGQLSKFDGIVLILIYLIYISGLIKNGTGKKVIKKSSRSGGVSVLVLKMFFWIGLLLLSSQMIVYLAKSLAVDFDLSVLFVGLFLVAIGTSLPELIFNIKATAKRKISMSMGNIVGSCVANSTLVIGLAAVIAPIEVTNSYQIVLPGIEYLFVVLLMLVFVWSKHRLDWWEGLVLIILFVYYTAVGVAIF